MWVIAVNTPFFFDAVGSDKVGIISIFHGIVTVFGTLFVFIFMKETKGKT